MSNKVCKKRWRCASPFFTIFEKPEARFTELIHQGRVNNLFVVYWGGGVNHGEMKALSARLLFPVEPEQNELLLRDLDRIFAACDIPGGNNTLIRKISYEQANWVTGPIDIVNGQEVLLTGLCEK